MPALRYWVHGVIRVMTIPHISASAIKSGPMNFVRQQRRAVILTGTIITGNVLIWIAALFTFRERNILLTTAFMAYLFGLRHALDADHIAAIDNVTRRLVAEKKPALTAGLFFSLGHSTIVVLLSIMVAAGFTHAQRSFPALESTGAVIGTAVSAIFLFGIAMANLLVLRQTIDLMRNPGHANGGNAAGGTVGPLTRLLRPLLRCVRAGWQMYPVGVLFGLGFDTATEIGLLGIAAAAAVNHLPIWSIMLFPALFTAGMTLVDTADGILMCQAYGWALIHPMRKAIYNLTMTGLSIILALSVALIESLDVARSQWKLHGWLWRLVRSVNGAGNWEGLGLLAVALFAVGFAAAWLLNRRRERMFAAQTVS